MSEPDKDECERIIALFEMVERGSKDDASDHVKNEAANAITPLFKALGKHGLSVGDMPEIRHRFAQLEAAEAGAASSATNTAAPQGDPSLVDALQYVFQSYIDVQPHEYIGASLWALHTHVFSCFQVAPRLAALSPVRGCGKSKLLILLEKLTANPERHDGISASSIYRLIERGAPTLLLDEGDNLGLRMDRVMEHPSIG